MRQSMTGFSSGQGALDDLRWVWDLRSVNAKGLDVRLRVPDWIEGLEAAVKSSVTRAISRGSVSVTLRVTSDGDSGALTLNPAQLSAVLDAMSVIEAEAMNRGLSLAPSTAADVVAVRGVLDTMVPERDVPALKAALMADFAPVLDSFVAMRRSEGAALAEVLLRQMDEIAELTEQASAAAIARREEQADKLRAALARVMDNTDGVEEARVAQELAMIAVKSDITEELDRLRAHVTAARDLIEAEGAVGRKLDFLMQEFNREANTLCSKSGSGALTQIGLSLKTVIDQMREQVQNVE